MNPLHGKYLKFYESIVKFLPKKRIFTDPLKMLAYGTDASFYRLIPKIVIRVCSSDEVSRVLEVASKESLPVVFRAAGTSVSGQSITDSILIITSRDWSGVKVGEDGATVSIEPSAIGGVVNAKLAPYGKKIGPDPASINAAMIGGIAANNASGMCCGVSDNSYKTLKSLKIIFYDGSRLDTGSKKSIDRFKDTNFGLFERINLLAQRVKKDKKLSDKIKRKFKIKNTCGYSLNALIDFYDPIDIISHLMIGSEGTLGFIEEITYKTVYEYQDKASAFMVFKSMRDACDAVVKLKTGCEDSVDAAELIDRASLRTIEDKEYAPVFIKSLGDDSVALLVETRAKNSKHLDVNIETILNTLDEISSELPIEFTKDKEQYSSYWNIRKGLYPAVGVLRANDATLILEDVAYPIEQLADGALDLKELLKKYKYDDAVIFGHALAGNLHFIFSQKFDSDLEIKKYDDFMQEVALMVAVKYSGSLKAEHGTGRNMASFVETQWGEDAYGLIKEIKQIFDPKGVLNPGVILNDDKKVHLKNTKLMPQTDNIIDKCVECGFCERACPSNILSLTPRQRVVALRHMQSLNGDELKVFKKLYQYDGIETCATCSLCSMLCPVGIDVGSITKRLRARQVGSFGKKVASTIAKRYSNTLKIGSGALSGVKWINKNLICDSSMTKMSVALRTISRGTLPLWTKSLPSGYSSKVKTELKSKDKVVYFSSCINRTMANPSQKNGELPLDVVVIGLLERAGYEVIVPNSIENLCCGMPFSSKGYIEAGKRKSNELEIKLRGASKNGMYPIVCDMSPCSKTIVNNFPKTLRVYDSVEFIAEFLLDRLEFKQTQEPIVIHTTCSTKKIGLAKKLEQIARVCSSSVTVPEDIECCGFAGDRGFTFPELNSSALRELKSSIPSDVKYAFSTSKTCEIGLSEHSGIDYRSIFYLVDRCTK